MPDKLKSAIRASIKNIRSKLSLTYRTTASKQICTRIRALEPYRKAKHIALYHAANGEVDLNAIWSSAPLQGKFCYFPALKEDNSLLFLPATPATPFKKNKFGIDEPDVSHDLAVDINKLDLLFIPLVAFDLRCFRIGMGAGYYDRTLQGITKPALFGVAYQFQRVDLLIPDPWDVPLDGVITNRAMYWREAQL